MGKYFGTDGFRGEAGVSLTVEHAFRVGRFLGYFYGKDHKAKVLIGKDTRRSGDMLEYALVAGLTAGGADVYRLHVTPTPSVAYLVKKEGFDCGIMITASHNPFYDNGIKVINGEGYKLEAEIEEQIENYIDGIIEEVPYARRDAIGVTLDYPEGRKNYIDYLVSVAGRSYEGMKVGLDLANGSATSVAKEVFEALGAETYVINSNPDGFNINTNCGSTHIEGLQKLVTEKGLHVGFAYDGDADRCLAVDQTGKLVEGDHIMYLCGKYMKENNELSNNTVVTTVMSNLGLYRAFDELGISYEKTAVGDKYVHENMMANGHSIGGENSGHIIFMKHATTGDGVLTSLKVMEVMCATGKSLSELSGGMTVYPQLLVNVRVTDKKDAQADPVVQAKVAEVAELLGNDGRILVRESGTEPLIRVMVEAGTEELCKQYTQAVVDALQNRGFVL